MGAPALGFRSEAGLLGQLHELTKVIKKERTLETRNQSIRA